MDAAALRQMIGLAYGIGLESQKGPGEVLIVDQAEKASAN